MSNHAQLPSINDAQLPETYERAKTALSECSSLDECKSWADKSAALASYARQSKDESLRKMAERIQARAIRRAGELLKQIMPNKGGRPSETSAVTHPSLSRKEAGDEAGLSPHQQKQAVNVANVAESEFTAMVESDTPPTVTNLAEIGTKKQLVDLKGRDPKEFNIALHFVGDFERRLRECEKYDIGKSISVLNEQERYRLRKAINKIDSIHDQIMTRI